MRATHHDPLARFAFGWCSLEIKKIALHNERVEEPPVFDKSISGDLLFEMLSLFIGVEKIAYLLL